MLTMIIDGCKEINKLRFLGLIVVVKVLDNEAGRRVDI